MAEPDTTPSDPETVLQALREHAAEETAEADALTADVKSLTEAIAALTKSREDITKAELAYQKADHPKAIAAIEAYAEQKRSCVDSSLGDHLEAAERLVREFTAEVDTVAEQLETAATELRKAQQDAAAKTKTLAGASARFDARLALPDSLKPPVDALAKLQAGLKAAIDAGEHFGAFAIDRELLRAAGELDPPALTEYRGLLVADWNAVATAQQDARDAGKTVASRQGDVDKLTLRLAALTADRVAELQRRWRAQAG